MQVSDRLPRLCSKQPERRNGGRMVLRGRVAWFDIKKQFGFVQVPGLRDTFLHMSVLKQAGYAYVPPGTTVRFTVETLKNSRVWLSFSRLIPARRTRGSPNPCGVSRLPPSQAMSYPCHNQTKWCFVFLFVQD